jgi:hypothetical protein
VRGAGGWRAEKSGSEEQKEEDSGGGNEKADAEASEMSGDEAGEPGKGGSAE